MTMRAEAGAHTGGGGRGAFPKRIECDGLRAVIIPEATYLALAAAIPEAEIRAASEPYQPPPRDPSQPIPARLASEAIRRRQMLDAIDNLRVDRSLNQAIADVARQRKVGASTLRAWMRRVKGHPPGAWEAMLTPAWMGRHPGDVSAEALTYLRTLRARPERPSLVFCHAETVRMAAANGWGHVPVLRTLSRRGLLPS